MLTTKPVESCQSGAAAPAARPDAAIALVAGGPATAILELDPNLCHPAPGNRTPTMELVESHLLPSIKDIGQKVPGIVRVHPTMHGHYEVCVGNLRCFCCRILGIPFKAIKADGDLSKQALIKLRLTENEVREAMSPCELADDLLAYQQESGCTQAELAGKLHLSAAKISRALSRSKKLAPDLRPLVDNFTVCPSVATLIASLPTHDQQRELMNRAALGKMSRDDVAREVRDLKKKRSDDPPQSGLKRIKCPLPGGHAVVVTGSEMTLSDIIETLSQLIKQAMKAKVDGLDASTFQRVLTDKAKCA
jgi:ParB/RepB/Spo0J family partition protein